MDTGSRSTFAPLVEYKSPVYIYILSAVFSGSLAQAFLVARLLSATAGLVAAVTIRNTCSPDWPGGAASV